MWSLNIIVILGLAGAFTGFIAGLFGIGGGLIIVPVTLWALQQQHGLPEHAQHLAIGTSFAVMVFTSFSSMLSQWRKDAVDWAVFRVMAPGMVVGVVLGSAIARILPGKGLQIFFVVFTVTLAIRTLLDIKPKPSRQLPAKSAVFSTGGLFGLLSSWIGIGGGTLSVPFFIFCNVPMHRAVGTSSALGWPIACAGAIGYLISGWHADNLPPGSFGFIYLPAVAVLAVCTILFAPLGVKCSHMLPENLLKRGFGILLLVIAVKMLLTAAL